MEEKKELTAVEIYKKNQKRAKLFKILSPIVFWGCWAMAIICLIFAVKNSYGNIAEITDLLDSKKYTDTQIEENYNYLCDKYGEWVIGSNAGGFKITFVNISKAMFNWVIIAQLILAGVFFVSAYVLGKWTLPYLSNQITQENQDNVNMKMLEKE